MDTQICNWFGMAKIYQISQILSSELYYTLCLRCTMIGGCGWNNGFAPVWPYHGICEILASGSNPPN